MQKSSSWEVNSSSATQEIPHILWSQKVHDRIHNSPPPVAMPHSILQYPLSILPSLIPPEQHLVTTKHHAATHYVLLSSVLLTLFLLAPNIFPSTLFSNPLAHFLPLIRKTKIHSHTKQQTKLQLNIYKTLLSLLHQQMSAFSFCSRRLEADTSYCSP